MSVESTLSKAAADLREGRPDLARRRLHGLLSSRPTDLAVRHALALAYGRDAHRDEAGRWNYLDDTLDDRQAAAFERRFRDPARRLAVLGWPDPRHNPPPTPLARRRLAALYHEATGTRPDWPGYPDDAAAVAPPRPFRPMQGRPRPRPRAPVGVARTPDPPAHVVAFRVTLLLVGAVTLLVLALR